MYSHLDEDDRENFAVLARAIEDDPDDPRPYANRGLLYEELGMYERAISDFTKLMDLVADAFPYNYRRGVLYCLTGRYEQAIADLSWTLNDLAVTGFSDFRQSALKYRAMTLLRVGKPQPALEDIDRVLQLMQAGTDEYTDAVAMRSAIEKAVAPSYT